MKHIKKFNTESEYRAFKGGAKYTMPIITLCNDTKKVQYKNKEHLYVNDYLTIEAIEECTVSFRPMKKDNDDESNYEINTISYSIDNGITWSTASTLINDIYYELGTLQPGEHMLLKGNCLPYFNYERSIGAFDGIGRIENDGKYNVSGNIMSLLFGDSFKEKEDISDYKYNGVFSKLFFTEHDLISIENLILPATILSEYCYGDMFNGCENLIKPCKILPALTLTESCYDCMFEDCYSLIETPELPATTLAPWCYDYMFCDCTSLTKTYNLPAPILVTGCYDGMFYECTALITAPEILATSMDKNSHNCCDYMFAECTELITPPSILRSINVTEESYNCMFYDCYALESAPQILATSIGSQGCRSMFMYCESLLFAPELLATTLEDNCYMDMFCGCTDLITAPSILPATSLKYACYQGMFEDCENLEIAPELPATTLMEYCYKNMFNNCKSLNYIKCLATEYKDGSNIDNGDSVYCWLNNVAESGTFIKSNNATTWKNSSSGIPLGWTVQNAS